MPLSCEEHGARADPRTAVSTKGTTIRTSFQRFDCAEFVRTFVDVVSRLRRFDQRVHARLRRERPTGSMGSDRRFEVPSLVDDSAEPREERIVLLVATLPGSAQL
jgi:hypothetical protein